MQAFQVLCEMITSRISVETCSLSNNKQEIIGEIIGDKAHVMTEL